MTHFFSVIFWRSVYGSYIYGQHLQEKPMKIQLYDTYFDVDSLTGTCNGEVGEIPTNMRISE